MSQPRPNGFSHVSAKRTRVLFLTKWGRLAASTRYRFEQYLPYLSEHGVDAEISPLLDDGYLREMFAGRRPPWRMVAALARRILVLLTTRRYDRVVIHDEIYPYLPPIFEWLMKKAGVPYVYDFDDAVFHQYDQSANVVVRGLLRHKIPGVVAGATTVVAGNDYLANFARAFNDRVVVVPTVVDMTKYVARPGPMRDPRSPLVIGWIGTPQNARYVVQRADVLRTLAGLRTIKVILVGSGPVELPGVPLELRPWREDREIDDLQSFDVGIMPLDDAPWARGKCGFKLLQYMACGVPAVAAAVGANQTIVTHGVDGFLARSDEDWLRSLLALADDAALREKVGKVARETVEQRYSLQVMASRLAEVLRAAA